ncbi:MAG: serine/threonine protein kinase [Planctomycetota bacterium]|nr:MAG: serine/threonine protein kinase [Planctomycetota bacterium]
MRSGSCPDSVFVSPRGPLRDGVRNFSFPSPSAAAGGSAATTRAGGSPGWAPAGGPSAPNGSRTPSKRLRGPLGAVPRGLRAGGGGALLASRLPSVRGGRTREPGAGEGKAGQAGAGAAGLCVGPYLVLSELGRGSYGAVFLARRGQGPPLAVKVLLAGGGEDPEADARFAREARLLRHLDHPGVVAVREVGRWERGLYYAMDFVEGETLKALLRREAPLDPQRAAELVRQLAAALAHAHARGVVHRDVKPSNVLVEAGTGRLRLSDFGLARHLLASNLTQSGDLLGTPAYMAPEQFRTARVDERADVYALGVILYEALTGRVPFLGATFAEQEELVLEAALPAPKASGASVPPELEKILRRALERDPAERYLSAGALEADLRAFLSKKGPSGEGATCEEEWGESLSGLRLRRGPSLRAYAAGGLACGLLLVGGAALLQEEAPAGAKGARVAVQAPVPPVPPPAPSPPRASPADVVDAVFRAAARGESTDALDARLQRAGLPAADLAAARARLAFRRGRLSAAVRLAEGLVDREEPSAREARLLAGLACSFRQDFVGASRFVLPLAREDDPVGRCARAWSCLADDWVFSLPEGRRALELLAQVRAEAPDLRLALLLAAYFEIALQGEHAEAGLEHARQAQRLWPDHWLPLHLIGRALRAEDPAQAARSLDESMARTGVECPPTLAYLIECRLLLGEGSEARRLLARARSAPGDFPSFPLLEAVLCERAGDERGAEQALERLVRVAGGRRAGGEIQWLPGPLRARFLAWVRSRRPR